MLSCVTQWSSQYETVVVCNLSLLVFCCRVKFALPDDESDKFVEMPQDGEWYACVCVCTCCECLVVRGILCVSLCVHVFFVCTGVYVCVCVCGKSSGRYVCFTL